MKEKGLLKTYNKKEVKQLLCYRQKTMQDMTVCVKCSECNEIKPTRTHHCSACNSCVLLMDHHCPWVNNCIGLENRRYFINFLLFLALGLFFMLFTLASIRHHYTFKFEHNQLFLFLVILDFVLFTVMIPFNVWNWYLVFRG